ncbi:MULTISPECIES: RICIN domain-containing protein [Streptomyces]|uniref:RICIN domain-containing protein n=1 Tax=Streptomyces TaxID=1883 RepID=UPI00211A29F3|nr:RICIN domain-containing protein [Streptomyces hilarionis]MCQ9129269.1 RICIN domain-containing protein [Streptomyces hilarionis]
MKVTKPKRLGLLIAASAMACAGLTATSTGASAQANPGAVPAAAASARPLGIGAAFTLINRGTGKCVEVAGGSLEDNSWVVENDCLANNTVPNQNWLPESVGNGFYRLRNLNTNLCLDFATAVNGQGVKDHVCGNDLYQRWKLSVAPGVPGYLTVVSARAPFCLDLRDGSASNGTQIQIWQCQVGNNNQLWRQG